MAMATLEPVWLCDLGDRACVAHNGTFDDCRAIAERVERGFAIRVLASENGRVYQRWPLEAFRAALSERMDLT